MQQRSTQDIRQALHGAASSVRENFATLSDSDLESAYRSYYDYFSAGGVGDPPVSYQPAADALLLAVWDVIVDRETRAADGTEELEHFYAIAFRELLHPEEATDEEEVILSEPEAEDEEEPTREEGEKGGGDAGAERIYQLKVTLDGRRANIWRRILLPAATPKTELHHIIVAAMGWVGSQDYHFFPSQGRDLPTSGTTLLSDLLPEVNDNCGYEYESTSSWYHEIELEAVLSPEPRRNYPVCTSGKGACPPEEIGGIQEYERMLEKLSDRTHPEYSEIAGWLTQDFHPDAFNIEQANLRLNQHGQVRFRPA
jgi:hypothetical protein